ncbi:MAG: LptF/LptG family permease [Planctomycetia bacterium]|nr:LptF/LptG family permease [Planctomycetia bacterium]
MKILDRYIIRNYLINCILALAVMIGMYILLDIIVNFDLFTRGSTYQHATAMQAFWGLLREITSFYLYRTLVIFAMISGIIPLLAAGFTMVRMTRNRELIALLASGVSLYRVAAPIILCAVGFNLLVVLDQEVLMPANISKLLRKHGQVSASFVHNEPIYFVPESDHSLVLAGSYNAKTKTMRQVRIIQRNRSGEAKAMILAKKAVWKNNIGEGPISGGWRMDDVVQINAAKAANPIDRPEPVKRMTYQTPVTPGQLNLIFQKKAVDYLSIAEISKLMLYSTPATRLSLEKIMYTRITQLIMNMIMLLIGIPFLLAREPDKLVTNMLWCSAVSAICFITTFVCFQLAGSGLSPFAGAWLPVVLFGPLALVMLDMVKT